MSLLRSQKSYNQSVSFVSVFFVNHRSIPRTVVGTSFVAHVSRELRMTTDLARSAMLLLHLYLTGS